MGSGNTQTMNASGATTTQTTISGLNSSTTYSIEVAAVNNDLIGQYSTVETALTEGLYSFPRGYVCLLLLSLSVAVPVLTSGTVTITSISLSWTSGGSEGVSYEVQWQRDNSVGCSDEDQDNTTITDGSTSYTISGLEEDSRYYITVTASNNLGEKTSNLITPMTITAGCVLKCCGVQYV